MFSCGFSSGARDGRKIRVMFAGTMRWFVMCHPARSSSRAARYFFEMQLHGLRVSMRQGECCTGAACRANGTKEIGVGIALVGGLAWPCSTPGPLPHDAILLANAGLILEPDLNSRRGRNVVQVELQRGGKVFLKAAIVSASWPGWRGHELIWEKPSCSSSVPTCRS